MNSGIAARTSPRTLDDPRQPHCADHAQFKAGCAVCKQACANVQPYPVRKTSPATRSFGFTDDITESKLRRPETSRFIGTSGSPDTDVEVSLSLGLLRFLLRLVWPFSRIL